MSYFDDYVADGLCCEGCGAFMDGSEPGYVRYCSPACDPRKPKPAPNTKRKTKGTTP